MKPHLIWTFIGSVLSLFSGALARPTPFSTAFTYQGQLKQAGNPVNNTADFQFTLWDAPNFGGQHGGIAAADNVALTNGQFTVQLDFGALSFDNKARWLEIAVRSPAGSG